MKAIVCCLAAAAIALIAAQSATERQPCIIAHAYNSHFPLSHDSYNSISTASNGKVYYVLSTDSFDVGAQLFSFDPSDGQIEHLGDLTEAAGEKNLKAIPQGKSHVSFIESDGKLYFASHIGYYTIRDGMEAMGDPPKGYQPYPGGHFFDFDLKTKRIENLAIAPQHEGIIAMTMDKKRERLYALTWPTGYFIRYDLKRKELRNLGPSANQGEAGHNTTYQTICRSLAVDPHDGSVYFTDSWGHIFRYVYNTDSISMLPNENMVKDYFGLYDPTSPGHMGYNWRQTTWYEPERAIYGVHGNSGYLFRFDPSAERIDVLDRITSVPSKRSGMFDQFSYGYLGFALGPDGHTLYYLTGGPIYEHGKRITGKTNTAKGEAKGIEDLHLVTWDISTSQYSDHGSIFLEDGVRPTYVNSIAIGKDGTVYALARIPDHGKVRGDLISFPGPAKQ